MKHALAFCCILGASVVVAGPPDGTTSMEERLRRIEQQADPAKNPFLNVRRLAALRAARAKNGRPADLMQAIQFLVSVGKEALRAGETEVAIKSFERLLRLVDGRPRFGPDKVAQVQHLLGIAFLRLAEEQNCRAIASPDRCLLPLRGGGIHQRTRGAENALGIYLDLVQKFPEDLRYRWLANLAAQALGRHPEAIPPAARIPMAAYERGADFPRFEDIAPAVGVDTQSLSGGAIAEDFDGDGDLDLVVSSWGFDDPLRIFWNDSGSFREGTEAANLSGITGGLNLVQADADNDGRVDILVLRGAWMGDQGRHPNSLLRNLGNGRFADVTAGAGLLSYHPSQTGAWADFDGDGDLDLFVGNESSKSDPHPSELWRNHGDGTFEEISVSVGLNAEVFAKAVLWEDVDDDGRPDLFVSNLAGANLLYLNRGPQPNGGWRFEEVGVTAGISEPVVSFPAAFFDFDQDGRTDLWVSGYSATIAEVAAEMLDRPVENRFLPRLYRNLGNGRFDDVTVKTGMNTVLATMGLGIGDLDNDGYLDLYAATGNTPFETLMPNRMLRNRGGETFEDVTVAGGFGHLQKGHGVTFADFDQDGDQDIFTVLGGAHSADFFWNALFENPGFGNSWIRLELVGVRSNHFAVGARIAIRIRSEGKERTLWRTIGTGGSFGANPLRLEVGLGKAAEILEVTVRWPTRTGGGPAEEGFTGLSPGASWQLVEGSGVAKPVERPPIPFSRRVPAPHEGH